MRRRLRFALGSGTAGFYGGGSGFACQQNVAFTRIPRAHATFRSAQEQNVALAPVARANATFCWVRTTLQCPP
jgi:hypothetical protein